MSEQNETTGRGASGLVPTEKLGRCATCKHWRRYTEEVDVNYHGKHAGVCNSNSFVYDDGPQTPKDGLKYWDYEGYSAGFNTGEEFGCVHWEGPVNRRCRVKEPK